MKSGGIFLVIFGLLALFIASTGRYKCFEQFFVGVFSGQCGCPTGTGATGTASLGNPGGIINAFLPGGIGFGYNPKNFPGGLSGGVVPFNFPFGDFPTTSPTFDPLGGGTSPFFG